jgi:heat shock protein HslJ
MKLIGCVALMVLALGCASAHGQSSGSQSSGSQERGSASEQKTGPTFEGTTWVITSFATAGHAVVNPVSGSSLTIRFKDGTVSGKSGCNNFHGTYTLNGSAITLTPLASTRKACQGEGIMEQEQQVLAAVQSAATWMLRDGLLDLVREDGARALTAHPQP